MTDQEKIKELWQILVMLKRELDPHATKRDKLELPKDAWEAAIERARNVSPTLTCPS